MGVASLRNTTIPLPQSPIRILRDVQRPGRHSAATAGLAVTAPVGHSPHCGPAPRWGLARLISPAEYHPLLVLSVGVHTSSKSRWSSARQKGALKGNGGDLFSRFAKAQLQAMGLCFSGGGGGMC